MSLTNKQESTKTTSPCRWKLRNSFQIWCKVLYGDNHENQPWSNKPIKHQQISNFYSWPDPETNGKEDDSPSIKWDKLRGTPRKLISTVGFHSLYKPSCHPNPKSDEVAACDWRAHHSGKSQKQDLQGVSIFCCESKRSRVPFNYHKKRARKQLKLWFWIKKLLKKGMGSILMMYTVNVLI